MKLKLIDRDNSMVVTRQKGVGVVKGKGAKYIVTEDDLEWRAHNTIQRSCITDHLKLI